MSEQTISAAEHHVLVTLVSLAGYVDEALDNSEERRVGDAEGSEYVIFEPWWERLCAALDVLKSLPDDRPGYTMGPAAKAQWALRRLIASHKYGSRK